MRIVLIISKLMVMNANKKNVAQDRKLILMAIVLIVKDMKNLKMKVKSVVLTLVLKDKCY